MTTSDPRCFACGLAFPREQLKLVGDALFCSSCFADLRAKSAERKAAGLSLKPPPPGHTQPPRPAPVGELALCFLCGEPAGEDVFVKLRGFVICGNCSQDLLTEPEPPPDTAEGEGQEVQMSGALSHEAPANTNSEPYTPGAGLDICAGCGRSMPGPGSYYLIADTTGMERPYCPACAPAARAAAGRPRKDPPDA